MERQGARHLARDDRERRGTARARNGSAGGRADEEKKTEAKRYEVRKTKCPGVRKEDGVKQR